MIRSFVTTRPRSQAAPRNNLSSGGVIMQNLHLRHARLQEQNASGFSRQSRRTYLTNNWGQINFEKVSPPATGTKEWQARAGIKDSLFYDEIACAKRAQDVLDVISSTKLPWRLEDGMFVMHRISELKSETEMDLQITASKDFRALVKGVLKRIPDLSCASDMITIMTLFADLNAADGIRASIPWYIHLKDKFTADELAIGWFQIARGQQTVDVNSTGHIMPLLRQGLQRTKPPFMSGVGVFCSLHGTKMLQIKPWYLGDMWFEGSEAIGRNIPKVDMSYKNLGAAQRAPKKGMGCGNIANYFENNKFYFPDINMAIVLLVDYKRFASATAFDRDYEKIIDPTC